MNNYFKKYPWRIWKSGMPALCGILCFLLCGCSKKQEEVIAPIEVSVAQAVKKTIPINADFSGVIESVKSVQIIPRVSGYIEKRYFKEGTFVKKGDSLYLIDPRPFQAKVDEAKASLDIAKTQYGYWSVEANRYTKLAESGAVSKEQAETMVSKRDSFKSAVEKAKADLQNAELNLSFTLIPAPFKGYVQRTEFYEGDLVEMQKNVLTSVIQMDPIYVVFNVSRKQVYNMQLLGRQGKLFPLEKMIVKVFLPDGTEYSKDGRIDYISFQIDQTTDCVLSRGVINNQSRGNTDFELIPGQYAPVRVTIGEEPEAILIPETAIVESQVGKTVYVVGAADNKVSVRNVETGLSDEDLRQITKGLKAGELVVTQGVQKVKAGVIVKPVP